MKIGILTFHYAHNYGAMLQAYALTSFLEKSGHQAELIDYRIPYIYNNHARFNLIGLYRFYCNYHGKVHSFFRALLKYPMHRLRPKKWHRFESFLQNDLKKSTRIIDKELINTMGYDAIICGSDQIWNDKIVGELTPLFFCQGINEKIIKLSYAASTGTSSLKEDYLQLLSIFDGVSVREDGLASYLSEKGIQCQCHIDPSLLLNKEEWMKLAIEPQLSHYILVYAFNETDVFYEILNKVSEVLGLPVACVLYENNPHLPDTFIQITDAGPREFLGWFKNADFVVTNSFHGTAFSMIFNKDFCSVEPSFGGARMVSLLQSADLQGHYIKEMKDMEKGMTHIDYTLVNQAIDKQKERSRSYFNKHLY